MPVGYILHLIFRPYHVFCGIQEIVFFQFFQLSSQNKPEALMLTFHIRVQTHTQLFFGVMAVRCAKSSVTVL